MHAKMAGQCLVTNANSDRQQNLLQLERQLCDKLKTVLHAFTRESEYQRQVLVTAAAADGQGTNTPTFIPTTGSHGLVKVIEAFLRASKPVVVSGPSGCGKSALIDFLARQHGRVSPPHIYKVQLAAETDARALLGSYHIASSISPSAPTTSNSSDARSLRITWLPGLLSVAVIEGAWLILENIDCAPLEVLSILTPVLDSGRLYIAEEGRNLHCAPGFRIFATVRSITSGSECGSLSGSLLNRHFQQINMQMPEINDCEYIATRRFPSTKAYAKAIMRLYAAALEMSTGQLYLTDEYAVASVGPKSRTDQPNSSVQPKRIIKRHINLRDLIKFCQRLDQFLPAVSVDVADDHVSSTGQKRTAFDSENDDEESPVSDLSALLFVEALDVFCMNISNRDDFVYAALRIGSLLSLSSNQVHHQLSFSDSNWQPKYINFCTADRVYQHLKIGRSKLIVDRENMRKRASSLKSLPQSSIAWHSQTTCIVNAAAAAVFNCEPLLLVGETGTGKTSIVQYLADASCNNLRVLNMSHYSESIDLIGGYKPLPRRSFFARLLKIIIPLIEKTFKATPNNIQVGGASSSATRASETNAAAAAADEHHRVEAVLTKTFDAGNYRALIKYIKLVCERAVTKLKAGKQNGVPHTTTNSVADVDANAENQKSILFSLWREAVLQVQTAEQTLTDAIADESSGKAHISFAFLEGAIVQALKAGEWLLLDEINLASSDALQCLLQLLDSKSSSLVLTERGDRHALVRHANFRLFACMNPSTDVGKRDLEAGLRNRFTELYVHEDLSQADLEKLVVFYMSNWLTSPEDPLINKLVKFYVETLALVRKGKLLDSTGKRPHFGIRSFCQALRLASRDTLRFKKRSLFEALCLRFLTQLDGPSTRFMEEKIQKLVFGSNLSPARVVTMLAKVPPLPEGLASEDEGVLVENFWISRGALAPHEQTWFVRTRTVKQNLCSLARAVALGRYPVLLQGETSIGKTSLVRYLAELSGNECLRINNHEHTDLDDYVGSYQMDDVTGEMAFREGPLVDAVRRGYWIILDELNLAAPDVLEALNRLLDDNRELYIAETGEVVKAHARFMLFATQNPAGGAYAGRKLLSRAFRSRFVELHFSELPDDELMGILQQRCSLPSSYARKLVSVMQQLHRIRSKGSVLSGKQSFITLRDLFRWAERYRQSDAESNLLVPKRNSLSATTTKTEDDVDAAKSSISAKVSKKKSKVAAVVVPAAAAASVERDWDQYLADHGYLLLAGRVRDAAEDEAIRDVLRKVFNRRVDVAKLFGYIPPAASLHDNDNNLLPDQFGSTSRVVIKAILDHHHKHDDDTATDVQQQQFQHIVWTNMLRRMLVLSATALYFDEPILLIGGTGLGKTTLCQMLASWADNVMQTVNCHMHSETADFVGSLRPVRHTTDNNDIDDGAVVDKDDSGSKGKTAKLFEWKNGPLVEAMSFGRVFLLDEINLAEDSVLERINSVLETDKTLVLTEKGTSSAFSSTNNNNKQNIQQQRSTLEIIKAQPTFRLVATMNPGGDFGKRELSPALRNRFSEIWCGSENDMSKDDSIRILLHNMKPTLQRFGLSLATQQHAVASAMLNTVRIVQYGGEEENAKLSNSNVSTTLRPNVFVSIRQLLAWTQFTRAYVNMMNADDDDAGGETSASTNKNNLLEGIIHGAFVCVLDAARHHHAAAKFGKAAFGGDESGSNEKHDELTRRAFRTLLKELLNAMQFADDTTNTAAVFETIYSEAMLQPAPPVVDEDDIIGIRPFLLRKAPPANNNGVAIINKNTSTFFYHVATVRENLLSMLRGMLLNKPILLEGPPGVGKTALVTALTQATGRQLVRINLSEQTDLAELFGADLPVESSRSAYEDEDDISVINTPASSSSPKSGNTTGSKSTTSPLFAWRDGPLLQALKCGAWILLDELNLASQAVLEGLNAVLDHRGIIYVPELNRSFHVPADASVRIFATQNPHASGHGRKGLPRSFLNRFVQVYCRELMPSDVYAICQHSCPGVDARQLDKMVKFFADLSSKQSALLCSSSVDDESKFNLRDLLRWCQLVERFSLPNSVDRSEQERSRISIGFLPMLYFNRLSSHAASASMTVARTSFDLAESFNFRSNSCAREVHVNVTNTHVQIGRIVAMRGLDAPFIDDDDETASSSSSDHRTVLAAQRLLLQDMATCVAMRWPVVLSGKHSAGKRTLVRTLAQLHSKRLEVMSLNAATDTFELIGGFEQAHLSKEVENFFNDLLECCTITSRSVMYGCVTLRAQRHRSQQDADEDMHDEDNDDDVVIDDNDDSTDDADAAAEQQLYDMADHLVRKSFELLGLLKQENYLHQQRSSSSSSSKDYYAAKATISSCRNVFEPRLNSTKLNLADEMLSLIASMSAIAEFKSSNNMPPAVADSSNCSDAVEHNVEQLRRRFYRLRKLCVVSAAQSVKSNAVEEESGFNNCKSGFEWVDSVLLRAMKKGHWILLENVNLCSPAVLDRLNCVFEPDGQLLISERGAPTPKKDDDENSSGGLFCVKPHREFRAFFTVDLQRVSTVGGGSSSGELKLSRAMRNRTVELFVPDPMLHATPAVSIGSSLQSSYYPAWSKTDLIAALTLSSGSRSSSSQNDVALRFKIATALVDDDDFIMNLMGHHTAGVSKPACNIRSLVNCLDLMLANISVISTNEVAEIAAKSLVVQYSDVGGRSLEDFDKVKQLLLNACCSASNIIADKMQIASVNSSLAPQSLTSSHNYQPAQTQQLIDLFWRLGRSVGPSSDVEVLTSLAFFLIASLPRSLWAALVSSNNSLLHNMLENDVRTSNENAEIRSSMVDLFNAALQKFAPEANKSLPVQCSSLAADNDTRLSKRHVFDGCSLVPATGDFLWNRELYRATIAAVADDKQQEFVESALVHCAAATIHLLLLLNSSRTTEQTRFSKQPFAARSTRSSSTGLLLLSNDAAEQQFLHSATNLCTALAEAAGTPFEQPVLRPAAEELNMPTLFAAVLWLETVVKTTKAAAAAENVKTHSNAAFMLLQRLRLFVAWSLLQQQSENFADLAIGFSLISPRVASLMQELANSTATEPFFIALQHQTLLSDCNNKTVALLAKFYSVLVPTLCSISTTQEHLEEAIFVRKCAMHLSGLRDVADLKLTDDESGRDEGSATSNNRKRQISEKLFGLFSNKLVRFSHTVNVKLLLNTCRSSMPLLLGGDYNAEEEEEADSVEMHDDMMIENKTCRKNAADDNEIEYNLIKAAAFTLAVWCDRLKNGSSRENNSTYNGFAVLTDVEKEALRKYSPLSVPFTVLSRLLDTLSVKYLRQAFVRLFSSRLPAILSRMSDECDEMRSKTSGNERDYTKRSFVVQVAANVKFFRTAANIFQQHGDSIQKSNNNSSTSTRNETDCVLTCTPLALARLPLHLLGSSIANAKQLLSMCRFASAAASIELDAEAQRLLQQVKSLLDVFAPLVSSQLCDDNALTTCAKMRLICIALAFLLDAVLFHDDRPNRQSEHFCSFSGLYAAISKLVEKNAAAPAIALVHMARAYYGVFMVVLSGFHPVPIVLTNDEKSRGEEKPPKYFSSFVFHQLDPALRQQVELELYNEQLKSVESKQRAHSILSQALFGEETEEGDRLKSETDDNNGRHPFLSAINTMASYLRQVIGDRQQHSVPYRPEPLALATFLQLKADICDYFNASAATESSELLSISGFVVSVVAVLQHFAGHSGADLESFSRWRCLTYNFIDSVLQPFSTSYNDLVLPLATGLHDTMDSLSALLKLKFCVTLPSPCVPQTNNNATQQQLFNLPQTSQLYMNRAVKFLRPNTSRLAENERNTTLQVLGMSCLVQQLKTSCLKSENLQACRMQSTLIRLLIKRWTQACDNVRAKRAEQQQLFKIKKSSKPEEEDLQTLYAERERIAEESDYRQAFPSYESTYADLRSSTPAAARKNSGNPEGGGDADSEREQAVRALSEHEREVDSLMTLSDRVIRFITECDAFAHSAAAARHRTELEAVQSSGHATANENAAFVGLILHDDEKNEMKLYDSDDDDSLAALYFQASMLLRHSSSSSSLSSLSTLKRNKNFYHDSDTNIALRCVALINSFKSLFDQLEKSEEFGGISLAPRHPVVEHLRQIFHRILQLPVANSAPVQFAVGLQLVVESIQSLLQQIPRSAGLHARVDEMVQFLFDLRKLELTSWQRSLSSRRGELENRAYNWYFRFYTLLEDEAKAIAAAAAATADDKEASKKLHAFAQAALSFLDTAPLVEFKSRLIVLDTVIQRARWQQQQNSEQLLSAAAAAAAANKKKSIIVQNIIHVLSNIYMLYKQFAALVDATIERCPDAEAAKAVTELKNYLKICRYDDRNFWAMRESIEKSRRLVHRCVRKYEVFLMSRALDWTTIPNSECFANADAASKPQKLILDTKLFSMDNNSSSSSLLHYVTRANELADQIDSQTLNRVQALRQRSAQFMTTAQNRLQKLQALRFEDLIDSARMPELIAGGDNKENKSIRKQIKTERRRAARAIRRQKVDGLHDLLAVLQHLGVSQRKGLLVTSDDLLMAALKCSVTPTTTMAIAEQTSAEFYAVLAEFGKFRARSMQRIADERLRASVAPYVESMRGYAHHAMWLAIKQRAHIVQMIGALDSLEKVDEILGPINARIIKSAAVTVDSAGLARGESSSLLLRQAEFRNLFNRACQFVSICCATMSEFASYSSTCLRAAAAQQSSSNSSDDEAAHEIMAKVAGIKFLSNDAIKTTWETVDKVFQTLGSESKQICAAFSSYCCAATSSDDTQRLPNVVVEDNAPSTLLSAMHLETLQKAIVLARQLSELHSVRCILQSVLPLDAVLDIADEPPFMWFNQSLQNMTETASAFVQIYDEVLNAEVREQSAADAAKVSQKNAADLNRKLIQPVMLVIEDAYKTNCALMQKSKSVNASENDDDAGMLTSNYADEIELPLASLSLDTIVARCNALVQANDDCCSVEQLRLLSKSLFVVRIYNRIVRSKLDQVLAVHERTCRTLRFSMQVFMLILERGFCEPYDLLAEDSDDDDEADDDSNKNKQKKLQNEEQLFNDQLINEQAGIGDGIGVHDVSDQIKSEDEMKQLLDAEEKPSDSASANQKQEKGSGAEKESDKAVEMKEHNFEGEYFDEEDENAAENEEAGDEADKQKGMDDDKDEPHREMGELGDGLHDVLNDEIWSPDDDEEKEKPAEEGGAAEKKPLAQEKNKAAGQGKPLDEGEQDEQMPDETDAAEGAEGAEGDQDATAAAAAAAAKNQQNVAGSRDDAATAAGDDSTADEADDDDDKTDAAPQQQPLAKVPDDADVNSGENMPADEILADNSKADAAGDEDVDMPDAEKPDGLTTNESGEQQHDADENDAADGFQDQSIHKQEMNESEMDPINDDKMEALPVGGTAGQSEAEQNDSSQQQQQNAARGAYGGLQAADQTPDKQQAGGGGSADDAQNDANENANDAENDGSNAQLAESATGSNAADKYAVQRRDHVPHEKSSAPQKRSALPPPPSSTSRRSLATKNDIATGPTPPKRAKVLHSEHDQNNATNTEKQQQPRAADTNVTADIYQHMSEIDAHEEQDAAASLAVDVATQEEADKSREQKLPPEAADVDDKENNNDATGLEPDEQDVRMQEITAVEKLLAKKTFVMKTTLADEETSGTAMETENAANEENHRADASAETMSGSTVVRSQASSSFFTQNDTQTQIEARERLLADIVEKMNSWSLLSSSSTTTTRDRNDAERAADEANRLQHAARLWQLYEQLTAPLARELCEQLRLVLEPTLRGKLRGDFRTGKRLNVRRIIGYIASDFRKDKIWLRRAQPSKRHYQVMLAVDDSQSMAELKTRTMAFEALATLSNALTWLEVGELGVCRFGEQFEVLHELGGAPFTTESACRVLARCQFSQRNTRIVQLIDSAMAMFDVSRSRIQQLAGGGSGGGLVSQLLLIVSDGHNIFADGEDRVLSSVRAAVSTPGVCIVYIILRNPAHNVSVLDMKRSVFDKDNKVTLTNYMDDFPFPLYVILNDSSELPSVLGDAIKQWFEMLVSENL